MQALMSRLASGLILFGIVYSLCEWLGTAEAALTVATFGAFMSDLNSDLQRKRIERLEEKIQRLSEKIAPRDD